MARPSKNPEAASTRNHGRSRFRPRLRAPIVVRGVAEVAASHEAG